MGEDRYQFQARLAQLNRKHAAMAAGCDAQMRADGLIVVKPGKTRHRVTPRGIVYLLAAVLLFKAVLMAALGQATYAERIATLGQGNLLEQAGAAVMQSDPLSLLLSEKIRPILR